MLKILNVVSLFNIVSLYLQESAVECSFTGKEPAVEYEVERLKCGKK